MALSQARRQLADDAGPDQPDVAQPTPAPTADLPRWLPTVLVTAGGGVVGLGGVGLLLADLGHYNFAVALIAGIVGAGFGLLVMLRYRRIDTTVTRTDNVAAIVMGAVAVVLALWNGLHAAHHVSVDSDPGVYAETGKWIATQGNLTVPYSSIWTSTGVEASSASSGVYPHAGSTVQFQFVHMVGALLAGVDRIGGSWLMFRLPAVLGSLGLCAIYCVGRLVVRRAWPVVIVVTAFGVSLPQLQVSRDTFSETTSQFLLWLAILLMLFAIDRRVDRGRFLVAICAGLILGSTVMAHVDAPAFFVFLPFLAVVGWLSADGPRRPMLLRVYGLVALGAIAPVILGTLDLQRESGGYYTALHGQVFRLYAAVFAVLVVSVVGGLIWSRWESLRDWLVTRRAGLGDIAALAVASGLVLAWAVRPLHHAHAAVSTISPLVPVLQKQEGLAFDPTRTFTEQSMVWVSWYLGPITTALAVIGVALLVRRMLRAPVAADVVALAITGTLTAIYLWSPSITEVQLWASRRYVTTSLPLLYIGAAVAIVLVLRGIETVLTGRRWHRVLLCGTAAVVLVFPLAATWPLRNMSTQSAALAGLQQICRTVGPNSAVLYASGGYPIVGTTRTWCDDDPSAGLLTPTTPAQVAALAAAWRAQGRTLWVLGQNPTDVTALVPGAKPQLITDAVSNRNAQTTLSRLPSNYVSSAVEFYGAPVGS